MGLPLSPETRRRLDVLFPGRDRDEAARLLEEECGNNLPSCGRSTSVSMERLRFAALKRSRGHLGKLKDAIQLAKIDWRDLLMAAGFGEDVDAHRTWEPL
ncbi:MAG TPA: hypothetical protein VF950_11600 [Planctomycetota bacterium]